MRVVILLGVAYLIGASLVAVVIGKVLEGIEP